MIVVASVIAAWAHFGVAPETSHPRSEELKQAIELSTRSLKLVHGGEFEAAVISFNDMIDRLEHADEVDVQVLVAAARLERAKAYGELALTVEMIAELDKLSHELSGSQFHRLQYIAAEASLVLGDTFTEQGRYLKGDAAYGRVIHHFDATTRPQMQAQVAWAYFGKGIVLDEQKQLDQAWEIYSHLIRRFENEQHKDIQVVVAQALNNRSYIVLRQGKGLWAKQKNSPDVQKMWAEAYLDAVRANQIVPDDPYILGTLGYAQFLMSADVNAEKSLRASMEIGGEKFYELLLSDATHNTIELDMAYVQLVRKLWFEVQMSSAEDKT